VFVMVCFMRWIIPFFDALKGRRDLAIALGLTVVVCVAFLPAVQGGFVYDDKGQILYNPRITAWSYAPQYFVTDIHAHIQTATVRYYRPIQLLWFRVLYAMAGTSPKFWHLSSILLHVIAVFTIFLLFRRLTNDFKGSAFAAGLFAIHPIQAEPVAWLSCSADLLLAIFLVLCLYCYVNRKGSISALSIVCAALAMFTKESGIIAPALIVIYEWIHSNWKNAFFYAMAYVPLSLVYIIARIHALGGLTREAPPNMSIGSMILTWPSVLAAYLRHLVWPVHLSPTYPSPHGTALFPLLMLTILVALLIFLLRYAQATTKFAAAWFVISLLPLLALRHMTPEDFVHDRYLYVPLIGLALIAAVCIGPVHWTPTRIAVASTLAVILCFGSRVNVRIWRDDLSLFGRAVEVAPDNASAQNNLAETLLEANRPADAYPLIQQLIARYPQFYLGYYNRGRYYQEIGDQRSAERDFAIAAKLYRE
jgi:protein O-mannosyl-transferase